MEVKATCVYNLKTQQALMRALLFPRLFFLIGLAVLEVLVALIGRPYIDSTLFCLGLFMGALLLGLSAYYYFLLPKAMYKQSGCIQSAVNYYLFTDECFQIYSKSNAAEGRSRMQYEALVRVKETEEYLFLFRGKQEAYAVDKASIAPGDLPLLRNRLRAAGIYDCKLCND